MLYWFVWNGIGIFCVITFLWLLLCIIRKSRTTGFHIVFLAALAGLILGGLGVILFFVSFSFLADYLFDWISEIHFLIMTCFNAFFFILSAFFCGKVGAYLLQRWFPPSIIVYAALSTALILVFQPIGYGWFQLVWPV